MTSIQISGLREDLETIELLSTEIFQKNEISAKTEIYEFRADSIEVDQILPVLTVTFSGVSVLIGVINLVLIIKEKNNKPVNQKEIPISIKIQASNGKELDLKVSGSMTNAEIKQCVDGVQKFVDDFLLAKDGMSLIPSEKYINPTNINKIDSWFFDLINRLTDIRKIRCLQPIKNEKNTIYKFAFDKVNFNEILTSPEEIFYLRFDEVKSCKNIFYILERENILCFHENFNDMRVLDMQNIFVGYKIEKLSLFTEMIGIPEFIFSEFQERSLVDQDKIKEVIKFNQMSISNDSIQKLLVLLRPYLQNENERRAYLIRALGMNTPVLNRLVWSTPVNVFITNMVNELVAFGEFTPGQPALCALLEVIREDVGEDVKLHIDELLRQVREELTKPKTPSSVPRNEYRGSKQTSFVSELRKLLVDEKQVYDLSRNEEFAEFNFIGFKETNLTIDLVAFVKADGLTEQQIVNLRARFFKITQIVSYDFGIKPGPKMPNGLLGFVFENECPSFLIKLIKKQTKIFHAGKSAVIVSWALDVKHKKIHTHNNPVSLFPPVVILENSVFPGLDYLTSFIDAYRPQSVDKDRNK